MLKPTINAAVSNLFIFLLLHKLEKKNIQVGFNHRACEI